MALEAVLNKANPNGSLLRRRPFGKLLGLPPSKPYSLREEREKTPQNEWIFRIFDFMASGPDKGYSLAYASQWKHTAIDSPYSELRCTLQRAFNGRATKQQVQRATLRAAQHAGISEDYIKQTRPAMVKTDYAAQWKLACSDRESRIQTSKETTVPNRPGSEMATETLDNIIKLPKKQEKPYSLKEERDKKPQNEWMFRIFDFMASGPDKGYSIAYASQWKHTTIDGPYSKLRHTLQCAFNGKTTKEQVQQASLNAAQHANITENYIEKIGIYKRPKRKPQVRTIEDTPLKPAEIRRIHIQNKEPHTQITV